MGLLPEQIAILELLVHEQRLRRSNNSLAAFIRASWPVIEPKHPYVPGRHVEAIADHLEAVYRGVIKNLLINIPPRHAKSTIVSVAFPAWVWTMSPEYKFLFGSHSFNLSKRDSVKNRQLIQSDWYRDTFKIVWKLAEDQNEKMKFDNTLGGSRMATSVGSSVIGLGADCLVLDDPHSSRSVRSEVQRQDELDWIDQEFFIRINDPKTVSKVVIMQRLDKRDASEHLLAKGDWEHLMLPAEFEPERKCFTSIGFQDPRKEAGDPLWPERFDTPQLNEMKVNMGAKAWAGQGQQRPAPAEGNLIKRDHFKFYSLLPEEVNFFALSVDLSFDTGATNSYAVFQLWARAGARRYLIKQVRRQMGFTEQLSVFKGLVAERFVNAKWVEKKANGAALISMVQKEIPGVLAVEPRGSKVARLEAVSPQIEAGNVYLPMVENNPWVGDYIEELVTFPNALHDDQVDATSQALLKMSDQKNADWAPISLTAPSKWR